MLTIGNTSPLDISLYFHIPFCTRKCDYCHFYVLPDKEASKEQLLEAFYLDWNRWLPHLKGKRISTIYFGGGTPFLFGPSRLSSILQLIKENVSFASTEPEITLEANPEHITPVLMQGYAQAGVNRVSIGIQTLDNDLLKLLGRQHNAATAKQAVHWTYEAGIKNISVDLMYDLPKQTLMHWESTLKALCMLPITHLSLYNLTIEPHTIFFKNQAQLRPFIPDEEVSLRMYERAIEALEEIGLHQYEISAFARPDYHSRHNVGYWTGRPFLGFGPSAFSYWEGKRFRCVANLNRYYEALKSNFSPLDFEEELDSEAHIRELFVIQLRLRAGISLSSFQAKNGLLSEETHKILKRLIKEGYLTIQSNHLLLTQKGILFYDMLASELI
jgi:oxygen-independent coproporphyrinogen-3 oxidase